MKNALKNFDIKKIITVYIIIQPLIDLLTSLLIRNVSEVLSIGIYIRTLFMIFIVIYSFSISDKKYRKKMLIYYSFVVIYIVGFLANSFIKYRMSGIMTQIKGIAKTFYLPIIIIALVPILKDKKNRIDKKTFIYSLLGYTSVIFLARIFNIGYNTYYSATKIGTVGLFYAANEVGSILCCIFPILVLCLLKGTDNKKEKYLYIISLILFIFSILEMGTKVPFIGSLGLALLVIIICLVLYLKGRNKDYLKKGIMTTIILLISFVLIPAFPLGNNLNLIKEENKDSTKKSEVVYKIENYNNTKIMHLNIAKKDYQSSIISGREDFLKENIQRYKDSNIVDKLFGIGYLRKDIDEVTPLKLVEMDYFDIALCNGILGIIAYFIPFIILIIPIIKGLIKNFKLVITNQEIIFMGYSILSCLGIALLAGHVLTAPANGIFIAVILIQLYEKIKDVEN